MLQVNTMYGFYFYRPSDFLMPFELLIVTLRFTIYGKAYFLQAIWPPKGQL